MSADGGDSLRIPIEIKTEDLDEIRQLINDITKADDDLQHLKAVPKKGRGTGDNSSRSAFTSPEPREGGIFGGRDGAALPQQGRDKTSKTPLQRESEFAKLQHQVQEQEARSGGGLDAVQGGLGQVSQGLGFASLLGGPNPAPGALGGVVGAAGKAFLPLAIITTIVSIAKGVLDSALGPGGPLDRRFKRQISNEQASASSLELKARVNQDKLVIRTQVYPNIRGEAGTGSNLRTGQTFDLGLANNMAGLP